MTTPAWPATLPQFVLESGYGEALPDVTIESQVDGGAPKRRRRFTTAWRPIDCAIECDATQAATFETFWGATCASGSLDFTWVHPRTRTAATFRWRGGPPQAQVFGAANVRYRLTLWLLTAP